MTDKTADLVLKQLPINTNGTIDVLLLSLATLVLEMLTEALPRIH